MRLLNFATLYDYGLLTVLLIPTIWELNYFPYFWELLIQWSGTHIN